MTTIDHLAQARELRERLRRAEEASREHGPLAAVRYAVLADDLLATALAEAEARALERAAMIAIRRPVPDGLEDPFIHTWTMACLDIGEGIQALIQPASKGGGE